MRSNHSAMPCYTIIIHHKINFVKVHNDISENIVALTIAKVNTHRSEKVCAFTLDEAQSSKSAKKCKKTVFKIRQKYILGVYCIKLQYFELK